MIPEGFTISRAVPRTVGATFAVAAMMAVAEPDLSAQRGGPAARPAMGANAVELSLRLADRLELTQEQRDQLESVRVGMLDQRAAHAGRLMSLQSEVRAGVRARGSIREEMVAILEGAVADRQALRERYLGILTDEQRQEIRRIVRGAAWRQGAMRGRTGTDRWRGARDRTRLDRGHGVRGRSEMGRGRGARAWRPMDRGRGGDRVRGWRRPGGSGA